MHLVIFPHIAFQQSPSTPFNIPNKRIIVTSHLLGDHINLKYRLENFEIIAECLVWGNPPTSTRATAWSSNPAPPPGGGYWPLSKALDWTSERCQGLSFSRGGDSLGLSPQCSPKSPVFPTIRNAQPLPYSAEIFPAIRPRFGRAIPGVKRPGTLEKSRFFLGKIKMFWS